MSAISFVALAASPAATLPKSDVFACSFVKTEKDEPGNFVDLRAKRITEIGGESWQLDWADGRSAKAQAIEANFGSVGGSVGLIWSESGTQKRAFISYSDMVLPDGQQAMFLSLDKPSLWQPPGYVCQTAALPENRK